MPKIQKVIYSDEFECDGCAYEYRDRNAKPCSLCNRNYELYSDRYVSADGRDVEHDTDEGLDEVDYDALYQLEAEGAFDDSEYDDEDEDKDYSPYH